MVDLVRSRRLPRAGKLQIFCCLMALLAGILVLPACSPIGQGSTSFGGKIINALNGMVALSATDAWAVGQASSQGTSPLIEHWDGRVWGLVPAPGKGDKSILKSVTGPSPKDIWAVGAYYQGAIYEPLIEHWNGSAWSIVAGPHGPGDNLLESVAEVSTNDIWAVGTAIPCPPPRDLALRTQNLALALVRPAAHPATCTTPKHPLIEHWDGRTWSLVASPSPDPRATLGGLGTVVAFGPTDVWASGSYFIPGVTSEDGAALFEQWDGTTWRIRADVDATLGGRPYATTFFSDSDIWGAEYATSQGNKPVLKHWDGRAWSVVRASFETSRGYTLDTMAASTPDDLWAAGESATAQNATGQYQVFSMHWNGSAWSLVPCPSPAGGYISITASASLGPDDAWLAGFSYPSSTTQLIFLEHWDGHAWSLVSAQNPA